MSEEIYKLIENKTCPNCGSLLTINSDSMGTDRDFKAVYVNLECVECDNQYTAKLQMYDYRID